VSVNLLLLSGESGMTKGGPPTKTGLIAVIEKEGLCSSMNFQKAFSLLVLEAT